MTLYGGCNADLVYWSDAPMNPAGIAKTDEGGSNEHHRCTRRDARGARFRSLHRKLEASVSHIQQIDDVSEMLGTILERMCREFEDDLGFEGGRIYSRRGNAYVLECVFGTSQGAPLGMQIPPDYPPHRRLLADGLVLMDRGEPGFDEQFEERVGVRSTFAAIGVGEGIRHIIAFSVKGEPREEDVLLSLSLVRHVINLKFQQRHMAGIIDAARILQEGILPHEPPDLGGGSILHRLFGLLTWFPAICSTTCRFLAVALVLRSQTQAATACLQRCSRET